MFQCSFWKNCTFHTYSQVVRLKDIKITSMDTSYYQNVLWPFLSHHNDPELDFFLPFRIFGIENTQKNRKIGASHFQFILGSWERGCHSLHHGQITLRSFTILYVKIWIKGPKNSVSAVVTHKKAAVSHENLVIYVYTHYIVLTPSGELIPLW